MANREQELQKLTMTELFNLRKWAQGQVKDQNEPQANEWLIVAIDDEIRRRVH